MRNLRFIKFIFCLLCFGKLAAQCPPTKAANLTFSPVKPAYCPGDNITVTFATANQIVALNWNFNGTAHSYTTSTAVYHIDNIQGSGQLLIGGTIKSPPGPIIGTCPFNMNPIPILMSPQMTVNAGPDVIINGSPSYASIGASPVVTGGTAAYTYAWLPTTNFVNSTTASNSNPQVSPPNNTNYQLTVTDVYNCVASDNVMVYNASTIINNKYYAVLKRELDAGYYNSINISSTNILYFKFDEEYYVPPSTNLNYKVYDDQGTLVTGLPPVSSYEKIGSNMFSLNVASLGAGFYKLCVYNQKNELWQTRIKIN